MRKCTVISIMPHGPAYEYRPGCEPEIFWKKKDGSILGFWPREWLDLLGEAILKETTRYVWEVWQPDERADNIYSKTLPSAVVHRLFPANMAIHRLGIRPTQGIFSRAIIQRLKELRHESIIVMLYGTFGFKSSLHNDIIKRFAQRKFPIFYRSGGMFRAPLSELKGIHRPLTYLCHWVEHFRIRKLVADARIEVVSEQSESALKEVRKIYNGRVEKLTMGCNFDFWMPVPEPPIRKQVRAALNIPDDGMVFFASGNFTPRKQLDKLLETFAAIEKARDFFVIIAGHGDADQTDKLKSLSQPLRASGKALIHPFATGETLRNLYWASDIYVSVATDEGGPVSVMKAMACGLPVLSTPVGETADRMKAYGVGRFVPLTGYRKWRTAIMDILDGGMPESLDVAAAREAYHWPNVARRFIHVLDDLASSGKTMKKNVVKT